MNTVIDFLHAGRQLETGEISSRELVERCLERIADPAGEGARTFMQCHAGAARRAADETDRLRQAGRTLPLFAGIPFSVKDLFDEAGSVTQAGSTVLADAPAARSDAPAILRLKQSGMISIGRTTMTEFAFSGVGINPHFDTPANPWQRERRHVPGGSSSGAAISVSDGMACIGIGSDTGGSCRIPAALTGMVGYKPTARRIPTTHIIPLSTTLDSIGSIAGSVAGCWAADRVMAGHDISMSQLPDGRQDRQLTLGIMQEEYVMRGADSTVISIWEKTLRRLGKAGVQLVDCFFPDLDRLPGINAKGGFPAPESLAWHQHLIAAKKEQYDLFVLRRILRGLEQSAVDYIELIQQRQQMIDRADVMLNEYDAIILPTVPIVAPRMDDLDDDDVYANTNLLLLRNATIVNFLDRCAISLPCHDEGEAPVGLMIVGKRMHDDALFQIAAQIEGLLRAGQNGAAA
ncbi:amidase [Komagataeibacter intermedius]|nr:amidase [Komagataeibacter intermedius]MCF3636861.1 amidase [Komagataeibacter intermedius]